MKTRAVRIKLKLNLLEPVHEWAAEVARRKGEALTTLRDETLTAYDARVLLASV